MYSRQTLLLDKLYDSSLKIKESAINTTKKSADKIENAARIAGRKSFNAFADFGENLDRPIECSINTRLAYAGLIFAELFLAWNTNIPDSVRYPAFWSAMGTILSYYPARLAYAIRRQKEFDSEWKAT